MVKRRCCGYGWALSLHSPKHTARVPLPCYVSNNHKKKPSFIVLPPRRYSGTFSKAADGGLLSRPLDCCCPLPLFRPGRQFLFGSTPAHFLSKDGKQRKLRHPIARKAKILSLKPLFSTILSVSITSTYFYSDVSDQS